MVEQPSLKENLTKNLQVKRNLSVLLYGSETWKMNKGDEKLHVLTDHNPLIPHLNTQDLDKVPI
jgi:hypothetical protein